MSICEMAVSRPSGTVYADDCEQFEAAESWVPPETACSCGRPEELHTYGSDGCFAAADQSAERSELLAARALTPEQRAGFEQLLDESSLGAPHVKAASCPTGPTRAEMAERFIARQRRVKPEGHVVVFALPDGSMGTLAVPPGVAVRIDAGQLVVSARDRRPISITSVKTRRE